MFGGIPAAVQARDAGRQAIHHCGHFQPSLSTNSQARETRLPLETPPLPPEMSASAQGSASTAKAVVDDKSKNGDADKDKKPAAQLEEDDEFEDFPVEGAPLPTFAMMRSRTRRSLRGG